MASMDPEVVRNVDPSGLEVAPHGQPQELHGSMQSHELHTQEYQGQQQSPPPQGFYGTPSQYSQVPHTDPYPKEGTAYGSQSYGQAPTVSGATEYGGHTYGGHAPTITGTEYDNTPNKRPWLGLPFAVGALAAAIIVGAALGGGLGASLSQCQTELGQASGAASATVTVTQTVTAASSQATTTDGLLIDYVPPRREDIETVALDCPGLEEADTNGYKFKVDCGYDYGTGERSDINGNTVDLSDLTWLIAYSFQDCLDACGWLSDCLSVVFYSRIYEGFDARLGGYNCVLKNETITVDESLSAGNMDVVSSTWTGEEA